MKNGANRNRIHKQICLVNKIFVEERSAMDKRTRKLIEDGQPISIIHFDKSGTPISEEKYNMENLSLSDDQVEQLAKALLKPCMEFYSNPENVKRFEEWKAQREKE